MTGFVDGEGCFTIKIRNNQKFSTGWAVEYVFSIGLHAKDKALLERIQKYDPPNSSA